MSPELVFLVTLLVVSSVAINCPSGWTRSVSFPGKCYRLINANFANNDSVDTQFVWDCRNSYPGADVLAIANQFENQEVIGLLRDAQVDWAHFGLLYVATSNNDTNRTLNWIAKTGYTSFTQPLVSPSNRNAFVISIKNNGDWGTYYRLPNALCQLYPGELENQPATPPACPPGGWVPALDVPNKCVLYDGPQNVNFFDATSYCKGLVNNTAQLLILDGPDEQVPLWELPGATWFDYYKDPASNQWSWKNGPHGNFTPFNITAADLGPCAAALGPDESRFYVPTDCDQLFRAACEVYIHE